MDVSGAQQGSTVGLSAVRIPLYVESAVVRNTEPWFGILELSQTDGVFGGQATDSSLIQFADAAGCSQQCQLWCK